MIENFFINNDIDVMNFFVLGKLYSMYDRERMSCIYVIKEVVE